MWQEKSRSFTPHDNGRSDLPQQWERPLSIRTSRARNEKEYPGSSLGRQYTEQYAAELPQKAQVSEAGLSTFHGLMLGGDPSNRRRRVTEGMQGKLQHNITIRRQAVKQVYASFESRF